MENTDSQVSGALVPLGRRCPEGADEGAFPVLIAKHFPLTNSAE
jgi:hypothetical protein